MTDGAVPTTPHGGQCRPERPPRVPIIIAFGLSGISFVTMVVGFALDHVMDTSTSTVLCDRLNRAGRPPVRTCRGVRMQLGFFSSTTFDAGGTGWGNGHAANSAWNCGQKELIVAAAVFYCLAMAAWIVVIAAVCIRWIKRRDVVPHMVTVSIAVAFVLLFIGNILLGVVRGRASSSGFCDGVEISAHYVVATTWGIGLILPNVLVVLVAVSVAWAFQIDGGSDGAAPAAASATITLLPTNPPPWVDCSIHFVRRTELDDETWRIRFQALLDCTCRRGTLGAGRDQVIRGGRYDRLLFQRAWRLKNERLYNLYTAHRDTQIADTPAVPVVPRTHSVETSEWIREMGLRTRDRNEVLLWHGTKPDFVKSIVAEGFDERTCNLNGLFGAGVYFADEVSKSDQYVTPSPSNDPRGGVYYAILARVTLGTPAKLSAATPQARRAPAGCHSVIGQIDRDRYREYVIYDGWLAYPEFVVEYKRCYAHGGHGPFEL